MISKLFGIFSRFLEGGIMDKKEIQREENRLEEVCFLLSQKIIFMGKKIFHKRESVQDFQKNIWEK